MPADPIHPDQLGGAARFRADLVAYLDSLPLDQLADPLSELPNRQQPRGLGVLMVALNERLPDAYKLLPPAGQPGPSEGGAARYGNWSPTARSPAPRQPSGIVTGGARSATACPRTTSATVGVPTGGAPSLGCRWAAATTRSTTSRQTGRGDGWARSATARIADSSAARPSASPDPMPGLAVTA
jgi:hypothetical protein